MTTECSITQSANGASSRSIARYPFDAEAADVVFTTSDNVDFHIYKVVLSLASPFFTDMFSLAQPRESEMNRCPISIPETGHTFDSLLRLCYPVDDPRLQNLGHLGNVLEAAIKYQMAEAVKICRTRLVAFLTRTGSHNQRDALSVFALACRLHLEEEARAAAEPLKRSEMPITLLFGNFTQAAPPPNSPLTFSTTTAGRMYTPEIAELPADIYFRLIYYCRPDLPQPGPTVRFISGGDPRPLGATVPKPEPSASSFGNNNTQLNVSRADADIIMRSVDGVGFLYHTLLRLASANKLLESSQSQTNTERLTPDTELPVVQVAFGKRVLEDLLHTCHPTSHLEFHDPVRLWKLLQVAIKYDMTNVILTLREQTNQLLATRPLAVYFIAMQSGWKEDAERAARLLVERSIEDEYEPIMEDVPASVYYTLLRFHHTSTAAILNIIKERAPRWGQSDGLAKLPAGAAKKLETISAPVVEREIRKLQSNYDMSALYSYNKELDEVIIAKLSEIEFP